MKYTRLIVGIIVVFSALWIIVGEQMAGASADAVVNARVVTLRSDVAGQLELPERALGSHVTKGETLFSISNPLVDSVHLNDLLRERDDAVAAQAQTIAALAATKAIQKSLLERTDIFRNARLQELQTQLDHAKARLALLEGGTGPSAEEQRTVDAVGAANDKRVPGEPVTHALALDHAREQVDLLQIALDTAKQHVFLGDGYNDAPYSEQRTVELASQIATLEAQQGDDAARLAALDQRIAREHLRVNGLNGGDTASPVDGLYWQVLQANGVTVQQGDPVLRLVDCRSTMVTLSVTERVYNTLHIGEAASFRMLGESRLFDATVGRLAGSGAATVYNDLAVAPSPKHLQRFDVTLLVPGLVADPELGCAIGRTGRAFFDRRPLDWLRSWFE